MDANDPAAGQSPQEIRRAARSYIADLRAARAARAAGLAKAGPSAASQQKANTQHSAAPSAGKRGVRVDVAMAAGPLQVEAKPQPDEPTPAAPDRSAQGRPAGREALRKGAQAARAAAQDAQQKIRAARIKQREAAAQQRANVKAARLAQAQKRTQASAGASYEKPVRAGLAQRSAAAATPSRTDLGRARPLSASAGLSRRASPPLTDLRGIGDAMSRRLDEVGVSGMEDLVALSADVIRGRLGPISALANVEAWQAEAEEQLKADQEK